MARRRRGAECGTVLDRDEEHYRPGRQGKADEPASDRVAPPPPGPAGATDQHRRDGRLHEDPGIHGVRVPNVRLRSRLTRSRP